MNRIEGPLTLVVTRRCNLRCGYCPQSFADRDMEPRVLEAALRRLLPRLAPGAQVKLFGGEPLMVPALVRKAVELVGRADPARAIEIPTNGARLGPSMTRFLRARPSVAVALSRPAKEPRALPNLLVNFLLVPGENAAGALWRLGDWVARGARRFNLLPAYYVAWTAAELGELRRTFAGASRLLSGLSGKGRGVEIVNAERIGPAPLYNGGVCVDTDGAIYAGNLFLARAVEPRRDAFRLGSVFEPQALRPSPPPERFFETARECFAPEVMESTLAVDRALSEFIHGL